MSAEEAARRVLEVHEPYPQVSESVGPFCPRCLKPYPCDTAIVAQAVLDQRDTIDRLTAQLARAVAPGTLERLLSWALRSDEVAEAVVDTSDVDAIRCHAEVVATQVAHSLRRDLDPTDPDIAAAVQAMRAGRRVLDRGWLANALDDDAVMDELGVLNFGYAADAIIAKLKEAQ